MSFPSVLTLWSDAPRTRFFLIPDDHTLPPGDFPIHTITGRKQEVDPTTLAPFEKTETEAKEWLESQFGGMLETARTAIHRFADHLSGVDTNRLALVSAAVDRLQIAVERITASRDPLNPAEVASLHQLADRLAALATQLLAIEK